MVTALTMIPSSVEGGGAGVGKLTPGNEQKWQLSDSCLRSSSIYDCLQNAYGFCCDGYSVIVCA